MSVPLCYTFMCGCCSRLHSVNLHVLSKQTFKRIQALDIQHAFKISFSREKKENKKSSVCYVLVQLKSHLGIKKGRKAQ